MGAPACERRFARMHVDDHLDLVRKWLPAPGINGGGDDDVAGEVLPRLIFTTFLLENLRKIQMRQDTIPLFPGMGPQIRVGALAHELPKLA